MNSSKRRIVSYQDGTFVEKEDTIALEKPLTIRVNGLEFATVVCTPDDLEELVIGFLASEGVVTSHKMIEEMLFNDGQGIVNVKAKTNVSLETKAYTKRKISSCCGKSRHFYFESDSKTARTIMNAPTLSAEDCIKYMSTLQDESSTFHSTGGVHNAALFNREEMIAIRTDIGRHNALDKIYGYMLQNEVPPSQLAVAFSGRISSEVVIKLSKMGIGVLLSKSAPTDLALRLAEDLEITTVGFIRRGGFNVYTRADRIKLRSE
ncbi:formate dehydrogenase accessory sulfurtransferase FdhD [Alkalihalobacillus sp. CinArs1]|uniref:formate dehydrogenase accessory sulfurtransferase FdhD n=1 Tax=Alkalihalobacillus sp. CinArs1 TaxID=2995314 RepID=UPI0022DE7BF0|nr:formate dehydrogenase accessory sulfurtransferase FdhD [Alkalihalobacillus sp. CinArs1]